MCTCGIYRTTGLVRVVRAIAMDGLRGVCSFQETSNFSLQNACTFILPAVLQSLLGFTFSPTCSLFNFSSSSGCEMAPGVVLICISLVAFETEHFRKGPCECI